MLILILQNPDLKQGFPARTTGFQFCDEWWSQTQQPPFYSAQFINQIPSLTIVPQSQIAHTES